MAACTSPAATAAAATRVRLAELWGGDIRCAWPSFAARVPACPRAASDAPRWPRGRRSLRSRPKISCAETLGGWDLVFELRVWACGRGLLFGGLGPEVRGMRENTNQGSALFSSAKLDFSIFHFAPQVSGPFQRHSRVIRGAASQSLGTVRSRIPAPGCRPVRGVTRRHSERPRGCLQTCSLCGAGISVVPTGCACAMWREITAAAATHTTNPS